MIRLTVPVYKEALLTLRVSYIIVSLVNESNFDVMPYIYLMLIIEAIAILILAIFYRCPYCGSRFPIRSFKKIIYCPHCGKNVDKYTKEG